MPEHNDAENRVVFQTHRYVPFLPNPGEVVIDWEQSMQRANELMRNIGAEWAATYQSALMGDMLTNTVPRPRRTTQVLPAYQRSGLDLTPDQMLVRRCGRDQHGMPVPHHEAYAERALALQRQEMVAYRASQPIVAWEIRDCNRIPPGSPAGSSWSDYVRNYGRRRTEITMTFEDGTVLEGVVASSSIERTEDGETMRVRLEDSNQEFILPMQTPVRYAVPSYRDSLATP